MCRQQRTRRNSNTTKIWRRPLVEVLLSRCVLSAGFDFEIDYVPTACREIDSVRGIVRHIATSRLEQLILQAHAPGLDAKPVGDQSNFDNCNFPAGNSLGNPDKVAELRFPDGSVLSLFRQAGFWQPPMTVAVQEQAFDDITYVTLSEQVGETDFRQVAVAYSDGYWRALPLPGEDLIDWTFNGSYVIGETRRVMLESGEERFVAQVESLNFDPEAKRFDLKYRESGGTASVTVTDSTSEATTLLLDIHYESDEPVVVTSMYSTIGDNTSDMTLVAARDTAGQFQFGHIVDTDFIQGVNAVLGFKHIESDHNTNGPDVSVRTVGASRLGGVEIFEVEAWDGPAPPRGRAQASGDVISGVRESRWMDDATVTLDSSVEETGLYAYILRYSREAEDDRSTARATLAANDQNIGSVIASSSRNESTLPDLGEAWNEFREVLVGIAYHEAGQSLAYELAVHGSEDFDPGIEADTITRIFVGEGMPPSAAAKINGDATTTGEPVVQLDLTVSVDVAWFQVSVNSTDRSDFSEPVPFTSRSTVTLPNWAGTSWVHVILIDDAGNETMLVDAIRYEPDDHSGVRSLYDVNGDGRVTALDALQVINYLAQQREQPIFGNRVAWDTSGDGIVTTRDALVVINHLQGGPLDSAAESEYARIAVADDRFSDDFFADSDFDSDQSLNASTELIPDLKLMDGFGTTAAATAWPISPRPVGSHGRNPETPIPPLDPEFEKLISRLAHDVLEQASWS